MQKSFFVEMDYMKIIQINEKSRIKYWIEMSIWSDKNGQIEKNDVSKVQSIRIDLLFEHSIPMTYMR